MVTAAPHRLDTVEQLLLLTADQLRLPDSLDQEVREHYEALTRYLANGQLGGFSPSLYPQGSYRLATVVKPLTADEFDLDFVVELQMTSNASPDAVFEAVATEIKANGRYGGMVHRKEQCIRIAYSSQFHMDVVPAIPDMESGRTFILIPRKVGSSRLWQKTNPKGYASWFEEKSVALAEKRAAIEPLPPQISASTLQVVVQLLKRNHHVCVPDEGLRTPSIALTTMAAEACGYSATVKSAMASLILSAQAHAESFKPIYNPSNPGEVLNRKWYHEQRAYDVYRTHTEMLARSWNELTAAEDEGAGVDVLVSILGKMFDERPVQRAAKALGEHMGRLSQEGRLKTMSGGALTLSVAGEGNPRKTFYGDD